MTFRPIALLYFVTVLIYGEVRMSSQTKANATGYGFREE